MRVILTDPVDCGLHRASRTGRIDVTPRSPKLAEPDLDPGLFGPDSVTWRIHGDPSMLLAGFRALLLQAVHPLVMAGFDDNSFFRGDPWGRLRRTGDWIAHRHLRHDRPGRTWPGPDSARSTPGWHPASSPRPACPIGSTTPTCCSGCTAPRSSPSSPPTAAVVARCGRGDGDRYVEEMRVSARLVGLDRGRRAGRRGRDRRLLPLVRPELRITAVALRNVLWGFAPPMPAGSALATPARPAWAGMVALAAAMLPPWARRLYGLPGLPTTDLGASLGGRIVRSSALLVPGGLMRSPAHRAAQQRVA